MDTTKLVLIIGVALYGLALVVFGVGSLYCRSRIRAIDAELKRLDEALQSAETPEPEREPPSRIRSMWGNHR